MPQDGSWELRYKITTDILRPNRTVDTNQPEGFSRSCISAGDAQLCPQVALGAY